MRILFLDDSYVKQNGYLGYGGFCIAGELIRDLEDALAAVKAKHGVPRTVELKWSPPRDHFLRTKLKGTRHDLFADVLETLKGFNARVLCAVHALQECYGVKLHGWSTERAAIWAAKQQLRFLAERFETNDLEVFDEQGIVISDRYGNRDGEEDLIRNFSFDMILGTTYNELRRIALPPLTADSRHTALIQAADLITGIIVGTLGGSVHGTRLIEHVAKLFVYDPHHGSIDFASSYSHAVLGYGLKLFPRGFKPDGLRHLLALDKKLVVRKEGIGELAAPEGAW